MALIPPEGLDTEHYVAILVALAFLALWAIARGFRGIDFAGVKIGVS